MTRSRIRMKLHLRKQEINDTWNCKNISKKDIRALGVLMLEAYRHTIDYEGETLEDAVSEVEETMNGKYGPFLQKCSFVIEEGGEAHSASLVTWSEEMHMPLLAFSMTNPRFKNHGMAGFLLKKSINSLLEERSTDLYLVVTKGNDSAQHLYEKLGFQEIK
jgi:ribosomal protein S18 acetylase RimI-like enzyme